MPAYEMTFIARPDLSRADVTKLEEEFTAIITEHDGKVIKNEYWGLRPLAYKINKSGKGHYVLLGVEAPASAVHEVERVIGINENVVRHLTVRVDEIEQEQSAILRESSRDAA